MSDILIAGASGKIGYELLKTLNYSSIGTFFNEVKDIKIKNQIKLDLTNKELVNRFVSQQARFKTLIFLVGLAHTKGKRKDLHEFKKINYQALVNLMVSLAEYNKIPDKIIFSSTISVYGEKYNKTIYNENSENNPYSSYAITKLSAEQYLLDNYSTKSWILRFAPVYSSDFLLNINRRTKIRNFFYRIGNGSKKLSLCNIENIVVVIEGIINNKVPNGIYNISDRINYTYDDLLRRQKANLIFPIPMFAIKLLYYLGLLVNNTFLIENTIKLISNNIFPSNKIQSFLNLPGTMNINDMTIDDS